MPSGAHTHSTGIGEESLSDSDKRLRTSHIGFIENKLRETEKLVKFLTDQLREEAEKREIVQDEVERLQDRLIWTNDQTIHLLQLLHRERAQKRNHPMHPRSQQDTFTRCMVGKVVDIAMVWQIQAEKIQSLEQEREEWYAQLQTAQRNANCST